MKESKTSNIILGLIFISLGVVFLGNALNIWNIEFFFDGWWTLFIVIPSIIGLFRHGIRISSFMGIIIGVLLFLACQDIINWSLVGKIFIPLLLVVIGLSIIFRPKVCGEKKIERENNEGIRYFTAIFSGNETKIEGKDFKGANCVAIFGGIDLDLRDIKLKEDIIIECVSVFGGIDIMAPKNINIKTSGVPILGGIENKIIGEYEKKPTIYINYVSVFGGVEIK